MESLIRERWSLPHGSRVDVQPLGGGLESMVARATVETASGGGAATRQFVVKELKGPFRREGHVYRVLWDRLERPPLPGLLGWHATDDAAYLFLEEVKACSPWPWMDTSTAAAVCRELARLHDLSEITLEAEAWDYEQELARSAEETLAVAERVIDENGARFWRRIGDLRRVTGALPQLRRRLARDGSTLIHGDVHPGNVVVCGGDEPRVILLDWGRARLGSPMEDVASWLHSLGCWEPEARRRHDTLLREYLRARNVPTALVPALRRDYWFASASNGLSGAIRYHLAVLGDPGSADGLRYNSWHALRAWERVIRRTAHLLTSRCDD